MSDLSPGGTNPSGVIVVAENVYRILVSGSTAPPNQLMPPPAAGSISVASGPPHLLTTGGVKIGPSLYCDASFAPSALSSGVKSIKSSSETP